MKKIVKKRNTVAVFGYPSGEILDVSSVKIMNFLKSGKFKKLFHPQKKAIDNKTVYRFLDKDVETIKKLFM